MARHVVARAADLPPGSRILVELEGRSIGVFNVDGRFYAFLNNCPHQGAELCRGEIVSDVRSQRPGDWSLASGAKYLTCPWHGWEFDLETGRSWFDPAHTRVRPFAVSVEPGAAPTTPEAEPPARRPGPYVADTLAVEHDGELLVVEVGR